VGRSLPLSQVWDPAVATALYYQDALPEAFPQTAPDFSSGAAPAARRHVGVNVADLALLATAGDRATGIDEGLKFFRGLIARLQEQHYRVTLFTNGAEEDEAFLERLCAEPGVRCARAERPLTPGDLIALIRRFDCVVSHRLHAHIVCFSYAIPSIGLGWDTKVASFFQLAGRADFLVDSAQQGTTPDITGRVLTMLAAAGTAGATRSRAAAVEARQQLQDFLRTVVTP
jgi:polysaccharide pyruvyl transferase WcaK-like protein